MVTIWAWINDLKLRNRLALLYTVSFTLILGVTFLSIYSFSEQNRKEEFYKRLSDRALTTFKISIQVDQINNDLLRLFDQNTINSLGEEKILLFDSASRLIYSNIDSQDIRFSDKVLSSLKSGDSVYQQSDDTYERIGLQFHYNGQTYYGIGQASDRFGKRKVHFLALLLLGTFAVVSILIILLSFYLSNIVTRPITALTKNIEKISPDDLSNRVQLTFGNDEVGFLGNKFNELLDKVESAFTFQSHYIQHLSHELKTPLAVMIANAERALAERETEQLKNSIRFQMNAAMELSRLINALLDISKTEKNHELVNSEAIRIDETIFECLDEMLFLNANTRFDFLMDQTLDEKKLTISGNSRMLKMAFMNLIKNAVNFSVKEKPAIEITSFSEMVKITIANDGPVLAHDDQVQLFRHSFRGKNSTAVKGFGLGLVLTHRIIKMHNGLLEYSVDKHRRNCFVLHLPLAG